MRKIWISALAAFVCVPAFAQQEMTDGQRPMQRDMSEFRQARAEHMAQMKATEQKMEKLVDEYNKLKNGKKKEAKLAEIQAEVRLIHDKQLDFKREQLDRFEKRLEKMNDAFNAENSPEKKQIWVEQHTEKLIAQNGDIKVLFKPEFGGPDMGKGPRMGGGHKGPHKGCKKKGKGAMRGHFPPKDRGPVAELPVEKPVDR